jgi:hypothetical protein
MQADTATHVGHRLAEISTDAVAGPNVQQGVEYLVQLFGRRGLPGVQVAVNALAAGGVPEATVQAVLVAYTRELHDVYSRSREHS